MRQQRTHQKTTHKTWGLRSWALLLIAAWGALAAPQRSYAAYTATSPTASSATLTGDTTADTLTITQSGGDLLFNGSPDFDTTTPGIQGVLAQPSTTLTIQIGGGSGPHNVVLGTPASPASTLKALIIIRGNNSSGTLTVDDSHNTVGNTINYDTLFLSGVPSITGSGINVEVNLSFSGVSLYTGTASNTVDVLSSTLGESLTVNSNGADNVIIGYGGSVQTINAPVNVNNGPSHTNLTVDDHADTTARAATLSNTAIIGLAPAAINYGAPDIDGLTVNGGSGGNTFTVTNTVGNFLFPITMLNSGTGTDAVNVLATDADSQLFINGQSGSDLVNIGSAGSAQGILGAIGVANASGATTVGVDDSADTIARTIAIGAAQGSGNFHLTGVLPGLLTLGSGVASLFVDAGTNNDIFNVAPIASTALNLDGGAGNDTLNLNLTGFTGTDFTSTKVGAGQVTFSNGQPVTYLNMESVTPANQPPTIALPAALPSTLENTLLTLSTATGNAVSIGDPDAGANPVQLTLNVTNGTLSLNPAALAGLTFTTGTGSNDTSIVCIGTIANINTALNGMVFNPNNLFSGTAVVSINVNDGGNTGSGGAQSATNSLNITVTPAPRTLSIVSSVAQLEGNSGQSNMNFAVTLTPASALPVTVKYATANGTATAGSDYTATSGTLTFAPGQTTQTISVPIIGDTLNEPDETFTVTLSNPTNATLVPTGSVSTGTILNDDAEPSLSINDVKTALAATGSTPFVFTVTLSAASGQTVTVKYDTADGTAKAGEDYTATSGKLTFAPGVTTQTITVPVFSEPLSEAPATFTVKLKRDKLASIARAIGTGTIVNPTAPALGLVITPNRFSQDAGESVAFGTVTRNTDDTSQPVIVTLSSSNPLRAVPAIKTVTIPAGASSARFVIDAIADNLAGALPGVTITATAPGLAAATATVTVTSPNQAMLGLTIRPTRVLETAGATAAVGTVTRNTPTSGPLVVHLSSDAAKVAVPTSVTIPAQAVSVTFPIRVRHVTTADGPQRITITAKATGFISATAGLTVLDSESHLTAGGHVTTLIAADAGTTGLNGGTNLTSAGGTPARPIQVGVPNAVVTLFTGSTVRDVVTTDQSGAYSFTNLPAGSYSITVAQPGYTFAPATQLVTLTTANAPGLDFKGTVNTSLSGRVINRLADGSRAPLAGITVVARSGHGLFTTRTDRKGHYSFTGLALDAYVVVPALQGTFFAPTAQIVVLNAANPILTTADFVPAGLDRIAPTAKVIGPLADHYTAANQPTKVTGSAQDTGSAGVAYVTVAILSYASPTSNTPTAFLNFNTGKFGAASALTEKLAAGTTAWTLRNLPTLPAGFYGVRATATDGAGNVGVSTIVRYSVAASPSHEVGAPTPNVGLSTATANVATSSISLRFLGALDADTASDAANYTVTVNGQSVTVESAGYNASTHTVSLGFPTGALHSGDTITVSWTGL